MGLFYQFLEWKLWKGNHLKTFVFVNNGQYDLMKPSGKDIWKRTQYSSVVEFDSSCNFVVLNRSVSSSSVLTYGCEINKYFVL